MIVEFDIYRNNKATIKCPEIFDLIRDKLSVVNANAVYLKNYNGVHIPRIYSITPGGKFEIGLFPSIKKIIDNLGIFVTYKYSDEFKATLKPTLLSTDVVLSNLGFTPYDYQETSVRRMLKYGRGCILIGTGGGKTFIMSLFISTLRDLSHPRKTLIIVPTLQLVEQTYNDFIDYGFDPTLISKWSSGNPRQDTEVVVAITNILQSKKTNLDLLSDIDLLLIDEVHVLKKSNGISKIIDKIPTSNRFGFTGTLPEDLIDIWNIYGKIGPILYEKNSDSLRSDNFISNAKINIVKINYNTHSTCKFHELLENTHNKYICELEYLIENVYRNKLITGSSLLSRGNSLIMVDRILHGELLYDMLSTNTQNREIFFIQGDVAIDERERIRDLMEHNDNIICIAISKIFSTGINIKNIHNIIFATPGKAKVKLIQSIGRGLRLHENKEILRVIDFADNLHYSNKHLVKRELLYASEKLNYEIRNIKEKG